MRVIDTVTYFNEENLLDLRLNILKDVITDCVIVQANMTHSGKPKDFSLTLVDKFKNTNTHLVLSNLDLQNPDTLINGKPLGSDRRTWAYENAQRDAILDVLHTMNLNDDDIILCGDVDEIPNPKTLQSLFNGIQSGDIIGIGDNSVIALKMRLYYYYFNLGFTENDGYYLFLYNTRVTTWKNLRDNIKSTHVLRVYPIENCYAVNEGGWHFSFLNSAENIKAKIEAFAHQEFNVPRLTNLANIEYNRTKGLDPFSRLFKFQKCELDHTYPDYILQNQELLKQWIKK